MFETVQLTYNLLNECPSFGWERVNFPPSSRYGAEVWIQDERGAGHTTHRFYPFSSSLPHPMEGGSTQLRGAVLTAGLCHGTV